MRQQVSEGFLRAMADAVPGLIAHWDLTLRCSFANQQYSRWFGRPLDEIVGASMLSLLGERLFAVAKPRIDAVIAGAEQRFDQIVAKPDGTVVHAWVNYVPHRGEDGAVCGFFVLVTDVTPLHQAEQRALESESRYRLLADHSSDMIFHLDCDFIRRYASPACREILGYEPHELVGMRPVDQIHPEDAERVAAVLQSLVDGGADRSSVTNRIRHKDGHWVWVEVEFRSVRELRSGKPSGIVGTMRDISLRKSIELQLAEANHQLLHLSRQDGLTGLANRRCFDDMLNKYQEAAIDEGSRISLVMVDVDYFKSFNDRYGHPAGDECLKKVAGTITASIRQPRDVAARYGGEEFAILLPKTDEAAAALVADHIRLSVARLALEHTGSPTGFVTLSAGIASMDGDTADHGREGLLRSADHALYEAKRKGRNMVSRSSHLERTDAA